MSDQINIDIGAAANDGTGDPLRTAFNYVNLNFSNVWNTGLPTSNIEFSNNRVITTLTNANLILAPNGTGQIVANVHIIPNLANVHNLGAAERRWSTVFSQYIDVTSNITSTNLSANSIYVANYYYANGQPFSGGGSYGNSEVSAYLASGQVGNIIPSGNAVYNLGNASNQWKDLYVSNSSIYMGGVPITLTSGNVLQVDGNTVLTSTASGNIEIDSSSNALITTTDQDKNIIIQTNQSYQPWWYALYGNITADVDDVTQGLAYDNTGNLYVAGGEASGGLNAFLLKYNANGTLVYQKKFNEDNEYLYNEAVATDPTGNVYVLVKNSTNGDAYLVKLDTAANIQWQRQIATNDSDQIVGLVSDSTNIYLATSANGNRTTLKFDFAGNLIWQKETVGSNFDSGIATDNTGNVYVGGYSGTITKYNSAGNVVYQISTTGVGDVTTLTADPTGNLYLVRSDFSIVGNSQGIIQKLDTTGNSVWLTTFTLTDMYPFGITYDITTNNVITWGQYSTNDKSYNIVISSLNASNGSVNWTNNFGSEIYDGGFYSYGSTNIDIYGNVLAIAGYNATVPVFTDRNALILQVPANGLGQGVYGDYTYSSLDVEVTTTTGSTTVNSAVNQNGSLVISTGNLTISNNDYTNTTVEMSPGGNRQFVFDYASLNGGLTFPDGTRQTTGFVEGSNYTLGDLTITSGNVNGYSIGYLNVPQVVFSANTLLSLNNAGKHYYSVLSSNNLLTITNNSTESWPVGTEIQIVNRGTGNITVAQDSGVSLYLAGNATSGNRVVTTYGMATLLNVAANVWMIQGTGVI